jgi:hypothetical protein
MTRRKRPNMQDAWECTCHFLARGELEEALRYAKQAKVSEAMVREWAAHWAVMVERDPDMAKLGTRH